MTKDRHPRTTGSEPREDHTENANTWLNAFAKDVTSQNGEVGIIEKILEVIGRSSGGWCVEFGSWDGRHCSNTFSLIDQRGYSAVLIAIAVVREVMGFGTLLGFALPARDLWWTQWTIMVMPPGAFFMLAIMTWFARAKLVRQEAA